MSQNPTKLQRYSIESYDYETPADDLGEWVKYSDACQRMGEVVKETIRRGMEDTARALAEREAEIARLKEDRAAAASGEVDACRAADRAEAELARLRAVVAAAESIEWMAKEYAEAGGTGGPEMETFNAYLAAKEKACSDPPMKVEEWKHGAFGDPAIAPSCTWTLPQWDGSFPPPGVKLTGIGENWDISYLGKTVAVKRGGKSPMGAYEVVDAQLAEQLFGTVEITIEANEKEKA